MSQTVETPIIVDNSIKFESKLENCWRIRPEEGGDYVKSSRPRGWGFSRATMEITKRSNDANRSKPEKFPGNWDYPLQLAGTTLNEE